MPLCETVGVLGFVGIALGIVVLYFLTCIRVLFEYERGVVFRLGRVLASPKGPGLILVFWPVDRLERGSMRTHVKDVPPQDVITRDNVSISTAPHPVWWQPRSTCWLASASSCCSLRSVWNRMYVR